MFHCRFLFCFGFWVLWWFSKELENQKFFVEFKRFCDDITLFLNLTGIRIVIGSVAVVLIIFLSVSLWVMDYVSGFYDEQIKQTKQTWIHSETRQTPGTLSFSDSLSAFCLFCSLDDREPFLTHVNSLWEQREMEEYKEQFEKSNEVDWPFCCAPFWQKTDQSNEKSFYSTFVYVFFCVCDTFLALLL